MYHLSDIIDITDELLAIVRAIPDFDIEDHEMELRNITKDHIEQMLIEILHQLWYYRDI